MHCCRTNVPTDFSLPSRSYAQGWSKTVVSRKVAIWLSVLFCAGLVAVPLADGFLGSWREPAHKAREGIGKVLGCVAGGRGRWSSVVDANNAALETIRNFESSLEDSSVLAATFRPEALDGVLRMGGAGSEEAYVGRDGWIFYRPDVDTLVMRVRGHNDAAQGIADFAADLAQLGIRLVVVPVPGKATIHPEKLSAEGVAFESPVVSPVLAKLAGKVSSEWGRKKIDNTALAPRLLDATRVLWRRKTEPGGEQFLRTDSHWSPGAMDAVAALAATEIGGEEIAAPPEKFSGKKKEVSATGDTALMLKLPASSPLRSPQSVVIEQVEGADGVVWHPDRESPVLVLGDSYANIYSSDALGWGDGAGFAERLSMHLSHRVDKLARNDAGAKSAREMLVAESARNPGWLEAKRVVVWVMAAREFVRGDWSHVALPVSSRIPDAKQFLVVPPGEAMQVNARVLSLGALPSPGRSPYADYMTALHLGEIEDATSGRKIPGEALAYIFTMRNRELLPVPGLARGKRVKLRLSNYAEKADKLASLNRGDLDDFEVMMEEPNFAEWIVPQ